MTTTAIQLLRSTTPQLRPNPATLADGMPCLNIHEQEPGLFFSLRNGDLCKIGPVSIGNQPPNSGYQGFDGNCKGETWVDTSLSGSPLFKVFDGSDWVVPFQSPTAVTSVGLTMPSGVFSVANSPITDSGILSVSLASQPLNRVFAGPASGVSGTPTFRELIENDIPSLDASKISTGTLATDRIPELSASKITSGTLSSARIPGLDTSKVTSGVLPYAFGGTGNGGIPLDGEVLIGGILTGWRKTTLTAGNNINIVNGPGSITISSHPSTSPGGLDTQIQFNNQGVIAGDPDLTYDASTSRINLNGDLVISGTGLLQVTGEVNLPSETAVRFGDSGTFSIEVKSPQTLLNPYTLTLPQKGSNNDVIITDSNGNLSFTNTTSLTNLRKAEFITDTATLQETTELVFINVTTASTITLPTPTLGRYIAFIRRDTSPVVVTIGGTVDGVTNPTSYFPSNHADKQRMSLYSDGIDWYTCGFTIK